MASDVQSSCGTTDRRDPVFRRSVTNCDQRRASSAAGVGRDRWHAADHMLYHMVVPRREVLVQLDDDLVERLDDLARSQHTNRSELLRRGAVAVLEAAEVLQADDELRAAYRRVPQEPALLEAAARLAAQISPEW